MDEILVEAAPAVEKAEVVDIQFRPGQKVYFFDPAGHTCRPGDHVIIDTARGPEFGICTAGNHQIAASEVVSPLRPVIRHATAQDEKVLAENREKERKAQEVCLKKIEEQGLDMQLVSAECSFDGSKILFFFTADERVDFRELVKNLASVFHTRIELRQIGVRDKAKMVGGLGICGRPFCCASFLDDFQPVSIKMAKTQSLSLNPTKISGTCGRLMCCLKYEQDAYEDLLRRTPKEESFVDTPDGRGTVVEVGLLQQKVKVRLEENTDTALWFPVADIAVFRNGKAKKTDAPIPADWAPISGGGKRRRLEPIDQPQKLETIRFRYRQEQVVEEQPEAPAVEQPQPEAAEPKQPHNKSRRNRGHRPKAVEAKQPKAVEAKQPEKQKEPAAEGAEKPKQNHHRRRNFHHRRHKANAPKSES